MVSKVLFHYTSCDAAKKIIETSNFKLSFAPNVKNPRGQTPWICMIVHCNSP